MKFSVSDVRFLGVRDWSPDGKWLAVGLARTDGTSQVGIASVADGSFTVLKSTDWRGADRIAFSNDSKYIAYDLPASDATDQRDVFVLALDGSRETPCVVYNADDLVVGWSPDGKHLLFSSDYGIECALVREHRRRQATRRCRTPEVRHRRDSYPLA